MTKTLNKPASTETNEKYTEEQTNALLTNWKQFTEATPGWQDEKRSLTDAKISELAKQFQKGVRSIIGKLTRHNVYVAKNKTATGKSGSQTKQEIAQAIGSVLNLSDPERDSLETAGKSALNKIFQALAMSKPIEPLTAEQQAKHAENIELLLAEISLDPASIQDLQNVKPETVFDLASGVSERLADLKQEIYDLTDMMNSETDETTDSEFPDSLKPQN